MDQIAAMALFSRIVQTGSFARAAQSVGISAAAATERIAKLERYYGARLLNRTTRAVGLTEAGQKYYETCLDVLGRIEKLNAELGRSQIAEAGPVRIHANTGVARGILVPGLPGFAQAHPEVRLELVLSDARADFVRERVDFAVRMGGLEDQDLRLRRIGSPRRVLVAAPRYLQSAPPLNGPADLASHRLIDFLLPSIHQPLEWEFDAAGAKSAMQFTGAIAVNDAEARLQWAASGLGIAQTVCFLARPYLASGQLVRLLPEIETAAPEISILSPRSLGRPKRVGLALDFCAELIRAALSEALPPPP
jgi:LysR family transcriptional regulator for bpeEF and oprC